MKKTICVILATAFAATLQAAVPLAWNVETTRAQPAAFDCYRGETLDLRASLYNAGAALDVSGAAANLYWQTNGMGEVYWSAPATAASNVLSATWAPTNDVGAASYNCFIGVAGEIYRAAFRIRMLPSPGAVPSELDLPAKSINFATVTVINPPYYTQGEVDSALAAAAQSATKYVNAVAAGKQDTISDLAAIREGAELGATALQSYTESDPVWSAEKSGYATTNDFAVAYGMAFHASMVSDEVKMSLDNHRDNTNVHVTPAEKATWNAKQSALAFDATPTAGSTNPVTSGGVQTALALKANATNTYTKAEMDAALAGKLDKSGGEVTGSISMVNGALDAGDVQTRSMFDFLQPGQSVKSLDAPENSGKALTDADLQDSSSALGAALAGKANDADVVHTTGDETIGGVKTFGDGGVRVDNPDIGQSMELVAGGVLVTSDGQSAYYYVPAASGGGGTFALLSDVMLKADRASSPTAGNLAALDSEGNPVDSGKSAADFATACELAAAAVAATNYTDAATNAIPRLKEDDIVWLYGYSGITNRVNSKGEMYSLEPPYGMWREYNKSTGVLVGEFYYKGWYTDTGGAYAWTNSFRYGSKISYNPATGKISGDGYDLGNYTTNMNPETGTFVIAEPLVDSFIWRYFPSGGYSETYYDRYARESELSAVAQSATNYVNAVADGKQDTISDLAAIREGAELGATALQSYTETDPTVPTAQINAATTTNALQDAAIGDLSNDNAQTRQIVATWENFLDGSNVVFSITNYLSGSYNLDAAKLRILELRDGEYHEVYNSRDEILLHIDDFSNRYVRVALDAIVDEVAARLASKADRDWGKYTSAGGEAPSNTVYMTAPNTVFAGGLEYERVAVGEGMICVLTTRGAPVWTQGDEGTFKFQDDGGTNYFGFAKTDSYTIGANTDGITVQGGMVTMTYNITMSGRPCVWYKSSLSSGAWEQLNLPDGSPVAGASHAVTWEANPDPGTQVCYINVGNAPSGFYRATVEVAGEAKFMTNMPADLSGGIICTNTATGANGVIKPTSNGTTVQWTWSAQ